MKEALSKRLLLSIESEVLFVEEMDSVYREPSIAHVMKVVSSFLIDCISHFGKLHRCGTHSFALHRMVLHVVTNYKTGGRRRGDKS